MKVLSLTEPYATLIQIGKKRIETRSWKTEYRGELYIHASSTKIPKTWKENGKLMDLAGNIPFSFGNIICKCKLIDCVYMTENFIQEVQKNQEEYISGNYEAGRYAWILEEVECIKPLPAKGSLGLWDYYKEQEVMNLMNQISYGWVDRNKEKHLDEDMDTTTYRLQSPKEVIKSGVGVCWDQVELERYCFKSSLLNMKTYFICYYGMKQCPTHTFLTYERDGSFYWFEHAFEKWRGIRKYESVQALLLDVRNKFIINELDNNYDSSYLILREYTKPKYGMDVLSFYRHCESLEPIILED